MPRATRLFAVTAGGFTAIVFLVVWTSTRAHAQSQNLLPRHAVCQQIAKTNDAPRLEEWMNQRLVEGKAGFVTTLNAVCAW